MLQMLKEITQLEVSLLEPFAERLHHDKIDSKYEFWFMR